MDVLFLSASTGGGHTKAAEAVKEYIESEFPGSRTLIVDTLKYVNPVVDKLIVGSYLNALKSTPYIYGKLYNISEYKDNIYDFSKAVNSLFSIKLKTLICQFNPSIIVCTHPFALQMVSSLKKKNKISIPIVGILTDFIPHMLWLHDHVDAYVVAHEHMKYEIIKKGVPGELVYPYGIPISKSFLFRKDKNLLLQEMNLDKKTTFLIMGGSLGLGGVHNTVLNLLQSEKDFQIIAVTGTNYKLRFELEKLCAKRQKNIRILSYTTSIPDLMDISDYIITKPGGMTISESLAKGLPIFITSPIPGQEERNADFLINYGAAVNVPDTVDIESSIYQIINNPLKINHIREKAKHLAKPNAGQDIANLLYKLSSAKYLNYYNFRNG